MQFLTIQIGKPIKNKNIWGIAKKFLNTSKRVHKGDKIVVYASMIPNWNPIAAAILGVFEVKSEFFEDCEQIFTSHKREKDEVYPSKNQIKANKNF